MARKSYKELWDSVTINSSKLNDITYSTNRILKNKDRYIALVKGMKVPWYFVGIIHSLEADCNFTCHIHNGDPLTKRTVQVPKNRPVADPKAGKDKAYTWEESCLDCLIYKGWDKIETWDIETLFYQFERNNGFGYQKKDVNSPYLWSFTNHYTKGKYVADGKYDPEAVSKQSGCAAILKLLIDKKEVTL